MPRSLTGPDGPKPSGLALLRNAWSHHLDVDLVDIMTMDYGPAMDMGQAAISAAKGPHSRLGQIWLTRTFQVVARGGTPADPPSGATALRGYGGKCADVAGAGSASGTQLRIWTCARTADQQWTFG